MKNSHLEKMIQIYIHYKVDSSYGNFYYSFRFAQFSSCFSELVNWTSFNQFLPIPPSLPCFFNPQFRYKTRVYKQTNLDEKQLAKLHTKVNTGQKY